MLPPSSGENCLATGIKIGFAMLMVGAIVFWGVFIFQLWIR
jgi:hypothetical protein